jgi:putative ABC transport system permease protein
VRHRRREIAVRLALGARRWRIMRQLLVDGLRLAGAGLVAGAIGALLVRRWLVTDTPGMGSPTVWVWLAPPVALLAAVAIASVLPVRRALTVNPVTLLQRN